MNVFKQCIFGFKKHLQISCGQIPTLMFDPIVLISTCIQRACNAEPGTGKHVNNNNQLDEELAYTHFRYTENKHDKTS